jgi:hypothetical protein
MWIREFIKMLEDNDLGSQHLMYLDDLSAQKIEEFTAIALAGGVFPFPIPPGILITHTHTHTNTHTQG